MNSELKARFERLGPVRDAVLDRLFSEQCEPVMLRRTGKFDRRIDVAKRLRASGLTLRAAHSAISELAERDFALCAIPVDGGIEELARDLQPMDVALFMRRRVPEPTEFIAGVRDRWKLSQREFAAALGLDVRTLQNWEQGRNAPDAAVLALIALFDRDPALVTSVLFAPVPLDEPAAAAE
jgi:DNA-binding transcriptional regulator YiaG